MNIDRMPPEAATHWRRVSAEGGRSGDPLIIPEDQSQDPIIASLYVALRAAEQVHDTNCAEALRHVIASRLRNLGPETAIFHKPGQAAPGEGRGRALQKWRLGRVVGYVDRNLSDKISLLDMAAVAGLSRMHFASQFRRATGLRPHEFVLRERVRRAQSLLRESTMEILEIALAVGFQTQPHFTTVFKRFTGCTPNRWRARHEP